MLTDKEEAAGTVHWQSLKQSLLLVTAIFFSTILVAVVSTSVQKATYFISQSLQW